MRNTLLSCFLALVFAFAPMATQADAAQHLQQKIQLQFGKIIQDVKYDKLNDEVAKKVKTGLTQYLDKLYQTDFVYFYNVQVGHKNGVLMVNILYHFVSDDNYTDFNIEQRPI